MTVCQGCCRGFSGVPHTLPWVEIWGIAVLESPAVAEAAAASVYACWLSAGGLMTPAVPVCALPPRVKASCELSIKMCWHQGSSRRTRAAQGCAWPSVCQALFVTVLSKVKIQGWKYFVVGRQKSPRALGHTDLWRGLQKMVYSAFCCKFLW